MDCEYVLMCVKIDGEQLWWKFHAPTPEEADERARNHINARLAHGIRFTSAGVFRQTTEYEFSLNLNQQLQP